jgi:hypothetical protein
MMEFHLDEKSKFLVEQGYVTINVVYTKTGVDSWVRPVNDHPRLGVHPHETMTIPDAVMAFEKVLPAYLKEMPSGSPFDMKSMKSALPEAKAKGKAVKKPAFGSEPSLDRFGVGGKTQFSVTDWADATDGEPPLEHKGQIGDLYRGMASLSLEKAKKMHIAHGLGVVSKDGLANAVPKGSLCMPDFGRDDIRDLFARMVCIASELTNKVIVSRIRSSSELTLAGVADLRSWWIAASPQQRLRVLSEGKRLNLERVPGKVLTSVSALPCPFRGNPKNMVLFEEEESYETYETDDDEESTSGASF